VGRFDLAQEAEADLVAIAEYTAARWGKTQAEKYVEALEQQLTVLARRPLLGRKREELAAGLLSFPFASHTVFYKRADFGILVVRILHQRQDPQRHIDD
jgi:toxin ParE1/3/4